MKVDFHTVGPIGLMLIGFAFSIGIVVGVNLEYSKYDKDTICVKVPVNGETVVVTPAKVVWQKTNPTPHKIAQP